MHYMSQEAEKVIQRTTDQQDAPYDMGRGEPCIGLDRAFIKILKSKGGN